MPSLPTSFSSRRPPDSSRTLSLHVGTKLKHPANYYDLRHAWPSWCVHPTQFDLHDDGLTSTAASVDLDECIARLYRKELLADSVIEAICAKTKELLMKESNVVHIQAPVTVVGDIHGQFFDMIEIFKIGGYCPDTNYLFLGRSRQKRGLLLLRGGLGHLVRMSADYET